MMKTKFNFLWKTLLVMLSFSIMLSACKTEASSEEEVDPTLDQMEIATETSEIEVIEPTATETVTSTPTDEPTEEPTEEPTATVEPTVTLTKTLRPTYTPIPTATEEYFPLEPTSTPRPVIFLSDTKLEAGQSFYVSIYSFPSNVDVDFVLYNVDSGTRVVYDGYTDGTGAASAGLIIPGSAVTGEYWKVEAHTTEISPQQSATSGSIKVVDSSSGEDAEIYLSSTHLSAGETFTASVTGFPANVNIDFKLINEDSTSKVYADATTNGNGEASASLTVPGTAVVGESWSVSAYTTDLHDKVEVISGAFAIE